MNKLKIFWIVITCYSLGMAVFFLFDREWLLTVTMAACFCMGIDVLLLIRSREKAAALATPEGSGE